MKHRILSLITALVLCLSLCPAQTLKADNPETIGVSQARDTGTPPEEFEGVQTPGVCTPPYIGGSDSAVCPVCGEEECICAQNSPRRVAGWSFGENPDGFVLDQRDGTYYADIPVPEDEEVPGAAPEELTALLPTELTAQVLPAGMDTADSGIETVSIPIAGWECPDYQPTGEDGNGPVWPGSGQYRFTAVTGAEYAFDEAPAVVVSYGDLAMTLAESNPTVTMEASTVHFDCDQGGNFYVVNTAGANGDYTSAEGYTKHYYTGAVTLTGTSSGGVRVISGTHHIILNNATLQGYYYSDCTPGGQPGLSVAGAVEKLTLEVRGNNTINGTPSRKDETRGVFGAYIISDTTITGNGTLNINGGDSLRSLTNQGYVLLGGDGLRVGGCNLNIQNITLNTTCGNAGKDHLIWGVGLNQISASVTMNNVKLNAKGQQGLSLIGEEGKSSSLRLINSTTHVEGSISGVHMEDSNHSLTLHGGTTQIDFHSGGSGILSGTLCLESDCKLTMSAPSGGEFSFYDVTWGTNSSTSTPVIYSWGDDSGNKTPLCPQMGGKVTLKNRNSEIVWTSQRYSLTVNSEGTGSGGGSYPPGAVVSINAGTKEGSQFVRWQVESGSAKFGSATSAQTTCTIGEADTTVKAVFAAGSYGGDFRIVSDDTDGYTVETATTKKNASQGNKTTTRINFTGSDTYQVYMKEGVTQTSHVLRIVSGSPTIILNDLNINGGESSSHLPPISCETTGTTTLVLSGNNNLTGYAASGEGIINKPKDGTLVITSVAGDGSTEGSLNINSADNLQIGIGNREETNNIFIRGGNIKAYVKDEKRDVQVGIGSAGSSEADSKGAGTIEISGGKVDTRGIGHYVTLGGGKSTTIKVTGGTLISRKNTKRSIYGTLQVAEGATIKQGDSSADTPVDRTKVGDGISKPYAMITFDGSGGTSVTGVAISFPHSVVSVGESLDFTATVAGGGSADKTVTWSVSGASSAGTVIGADGKLTVAADETANTLSITATSNANSNHKATVTVEVQRPLPAPENLAWNGQTAAWDAVANAAGYTVQLLVEGEKRGNPVQATGNSHDFSGSFTTPGLYTFTVTAIAASDSPNYLDSEAAAVPEGSLVPLQESDFIIDYAKETIFLRSDIGVAVQYTDYDAAGAEVKKDLAPGTPVSISAPAFTKTGTLSVQLKASGKGIAVSAPQRPAAPTAPTWESTAATITLHSEAPEGETLEYSINGTTWQSGSLFESLNPGTAYNGFVRLKATESHIASLPSDPCKAGTKKKIDPPAGTVPAGCDIQVSHTQAEAGDVVTYQVTFPADYTPSLTIPGTVLEAPDKEITGEKGVWTWSYTVAENDTTVAAQVACQASEIQSITTEAGDLVLFADSSLLNNGTVTDGFKTWFIQQKKPTAELDNGFTRAFAEDGIKSVSTYPAAGGTITVTFPPAGGNPVEFTVIVKQVNAAPQPDSQTLIIRPETGYTQAEIEAMLPNAVEVTCTGDEGYTSRTQTVDLTAGPWVWSPAWNADFGKSTGSWTLTRQMDLPAWATGDRTFTATIHLTEKTPLTADQMKLDFPQSWIYGEPTPTPAPSVDGVADTFTYEYQYSADGGKTWAADLPGRPAAGQYQLQVTYDGQRNQGTKTVNFAILPKTVTLAPQGVAIAPMSYDGTANIPIQNVSGTPALTGVLAGDDVQVDAGSAVYQFTSANVGEPIAATAQGFALMGDDAGNYSLQDGLTGLTGSIIPVAPAVEDKGLVLRAITNTQSTLAQLPIPGDAAVITWQSGKLPGSWRWKAPETALTAQGTAPQRFTAVFTPTEKNFLPVELDLQTAVSTINIELPDTRFETLKTGTVKPLTGPSVTVAGAPLPETGDFTLDNLLTWESSCPGIVQVAPNGENSVSAQQPGLSVVSVSVGGQQKTWFLVQVTGDAACANTTKDLEEIITVLKTASDKDLQTQAAKALSQAAAHLPASEQEQAVTAIDAYLETKPGKLKISIVDQPDPDTDPPRPIKVETKGIAATAGIDTGEIVLEVKPVTPQAAPKGKVSVLELSMRLLVNGEKQQLTSPIFFTIHLAEEIDLSKLTILHILDNGTQEEMDFTLTEDHAVLLRMNSFSGLRFLAEEPKESGGSSSSTDGSSSGTSGTVSSTRDRGNSSTTGRDGSTTEGTRILRDRDDRQADFWQKVKEAILQSKAGDTIKVSARSYDKMPWTVMDALKKSNGVTLLVQWSGGEDIVIPADKALEEDLRIYYPLSYLVGCDFGITADPGKQNPETGSIQEIDAPVTAEAPLTPAGKPEVTDAQRGLAETPELAGQGVEKSILGVYEPEKSVSAEKPVQSSGNNVLSIAFVLLLTVSCVSAWAWKSRKIPFNRPKNSK